jgi:hypothetical protein
MMNLQMLIVLGVCLLERNSGRGKHFMLNMFWKAGRLEVTEERKLRKEKDFLL